jgi:Rrf2 family protein
MISQSVEYALRAIVTIAQHNGSLCTARQISAITQVPAPYLSKLMQGLVRAGLAKSQRGVRGGFVLTKAPGDLSIWDVIDAVEPIRRIERCPLGISTHGTTLCPLHHRLDGAIGMLEKELRETTIADLLSQPGSTTPLCEETKTVKMDASFSAGQATKRRSRKRKKTE